MRRHDLRSDKAQQVDFSLDVPAEDTRAFYFYNKLYERKGWHTCNAVDGWVTYSKAVGRGVESIRQNSRYMISRKSKELLVVILRYRYEDVEKNSGAVNTVESGSMQQVTAIAYELDSKIFAMTNALYRCDMQ